MTHQTETVSTVLQPVWTWKQKCVKVLVDVLVGLNVYSPFFIHVFFSHTTIKEIGGFYMKRLRCAPSLFSRPSLE